MKKYSRLFKYLRFYKGNIFLYFLFTIFSILFSLLSLGTLPFFLGLIFNPEKLVLQKPAAIHGSTDLFNYVNYEISNLIVTNGANGPILALAFICVIIIISVLLKNLFLYLSYYVLAPIKNSIMTRLRQELYDKLLQLPIGFFTEQRKGDVMSRMTNDIGELEGSVVGALEGFIKDPLNIIIILATLIYISPALSLFLLIFLPLTGLIIGRISRSLKKQSNEAAIMLGEALSVLDETLGGLRVIKAFNAEKILQGRFNNTNNELFHVRNKMQFRRDLASPLSELLGVMVLCGILWFGGRLVLAGTAGLKAEGFIMYVGIFTQIINPAKALSSSFYNMQKGTAAITRIEEILNAPVKVDENVDGMLLSTFRSCIEFKNVSFSYDDKVILKNINLKIEKGKTLALVGSSGAGKSTLADLIPRFHDVTEEKAVLVNNEYQSIIYLKGVDSNYTLVSGLAKHVIKGHFTPGTVDQPLLILGAGIENAVGAEPGMNVSPLTVYLPNLKATNFSGLDALNSYNANVSGSFTLQQDFDNKYAITNIDFVKYMLDLGPDQFSAVEVALFNADQTDQVKNTLQKQLGLGFKVETRYQQNQSLYSVMQVEKWVIYAILSLILVVAAFNMIGALTMLVLEKQKDIAVLKAMGADESYIQRIFLNEGFVLAVVGGGSGILIAVLTCALQIKYKLVKLAGGSFIIDYYPVKMVPTDFLLVAATVMLISLLAAWIPSKKAGQQDFSLKS